MADSKRAVQLARDGESDSTLSEIVEEWDLPRLCQSAGPAPRRGAHLALEKDSPGG